MSTCATCDHGQHLRSRSRSLGFVACDLGEKSRYVAASTPCMRSAWKRREKAVDAPEVEAAAANDERRWWEAT